MTKSATAGAGGLISTILATAASATARFLERPAPLNSSPLTWGARGSVRPSESVFEFSFGHECSLGTGVEECCDGMVHGDVLDGEEVSVNMIVDAVAVRL